MWYSSSHALLSPHVLQRQSSIAPAAGTSTCSGAQCPCIRQVTSTTTHLAAAPPLTHLQCAQSRSMQSPLTKWFCTQLAGAATCKRVGSSNMQASTTSSTYLLRLFNNDVGSTFSTSVKHGEVHLRRHKPWTPSDLIQMEDRVFIHHIIPFQG